MSCVELLQKLLKQKKQQYKSNDEDDEEEWMSACEKIHPTVFKEGGSDCIFYDDLAGLKEQKKLITDSLINPLIYPSLFPKVGKGFLLYGPPGTGKTLIVKAAVNQLQLMDPNVKVLFFSPTGATLKGKYVGETEKRIVEAYKCASKAACDCQDANKGTKYISVIFIDELDSIAKDRNSDETGLIANSVNTLLQVMDGMESPENVATIGATNYPWELDAAVLRRFDTQVLLGLPESNQILEAMKISFEKFIKLEQRKMTVCDKYNKEDNEEERKDTNISCHNGCKKTEKKGNLLMSLFTSSFSITNDLTMALADEMEKTKYFSYSDVSKTMSLAQSMTAQTALQHFFYKPSKEIVDDIGVTSDNIDVPPLSNYYISILNAPVSEAAKLKIYNKYYNLLYENILNPAKYKEDVDLENLHKLYDAFYLKDFPDTLYLEPPDVDILIKNTYNKSARRGRVYDDSKKYWNKKLLIDLNPKLAMLDDDHIITDAYIFYDINTPRKVYEYLSNEVGTLDNNIDMLTVNSMNLNEKDRQNIINMAKNKPFSQNVDVRNIRTIIQIPRQIVYKNLSNDTFNANLSQYGISAYEIQKLDNKISIYASKQVSFITKISRIFNKLIRESGGEDIISKILGDSKIEISEELVTLSEKFNTGDIGIHEIGSEIDQDKQNEFINKAFNVINQGNIKDKYPGKIYILNELKKKFDTEQGPPTNLNYLFIKGPKSIKSGRPDSIYYDNYDKVNADDHKRCYRKFIEIIYDIREKIHIKYSFSQVLTEIDTISYLDTPDSIKKTIRKFRYISNILYPAVGDGSGVRGLPDEFKELYTELLKLVGKPNEYGFDAIKPGIILKTQAVEKKYYGWGGDEDDAASQEIKADGATNAVPAAAGEGAAGAAAVPAAGEGAAGAAPAAPAAVVPAAGEGAAGAGAADDEPSYQIVMDTIGNLFDFDINMKFSEYPESSRHNFIPEEDIVNDLIRLCFKLKSSIPKTESTEKENGLLKKTLNKYFANIILHGIIFIAIIKTTKNEINYNNIFPSNCIETFVLYFIIKFYSKLKENIEKIKGLLKKYTVTDKDYEHIRDIAEPHDHGIITGYLLLGNIKTEEVKCGELVSLRLNKIMQVGKWNGNSKWIYPDSKDNGCDKDEEFKIPENINNLREPIPSILYNISHTEHAQNNVYENNYTINQHKFSITGDEINSTGLQNKPDEGDFKRLDSLLNVDYSKYNLHLGELFSDRRTEHGLFKNIGDDDLLKNLLINYLEDTDPNNDKEYFNILNNNTKITYSNFYYEAEIDINHENYQGVLKTRSIIVDASIGIFDRIKSIVSKTQKSNNTMDAKDLLTDIRKLSPKKRMSTYIIGLCNSYGIEKTDGSEIFWTKLTSEPLSLNTYLARVHDFTGEFTRWMNGSVDDQVEQKGTGLLAKITEKMPGFSDFMKHVVIEGIWTLHREKIIEALKFFSPGWAYVGIKGFAVLLFTLHSLYTEGHGITDGKEFGIIFSRNCIAGGSVTVANAVRGYVMGDGLLSPWGVEPAPNVGNGVGGAAAGGAGGGTAGDTDSPSGADNSGGEYGGNFAQWAQSAWQQVSSARGVGSIVGKMISALLILSMTPGLLRWLLNIDDMPVWNQCLVENIGYMGINPLILDNTDKGIWLKIQRQINIPGNTVVQEEIIMHRYNKLIYERTRDISKQIKHYTPGQRVKSPHDYYNFEQAEILNYNIISNDIASELDDKLTQIKKKLKVLDILPDKIKVAVIKQPISYDPILGNQLKQYSENRLKFLEDRNKKKT